jgi:hypothetical protein
MSLKRYIYQAQVSSVTSTKAFDPCSKDFHVVHDPRIITELCLVNKEHQVTKDETPENKEKIDVVLSAASGLQLF